MTMEFVPSGIPEELKAHAYACWVGWHYEQEEGKPKPAKVPLNPNVWHKAQRASVTNPKEWATFEEAEAYADQHGVGLGFVLSAESGLCCIDLDATNDPAVQGIHRGILEDAEAAGAYIETSPSGKGWHIWLRWGGPKSAPKAIPGVECYTHDHYLTFTGKGRGQVVPMPDSLASRLAPCFAAPATPVVTAPSVELPALSDDEVCSRAAAYFGDHFQALWQGDWERLGIGDGSQSSADVYFGAQLARFTSDPDQWRRLFLQSRMAATLVRKGSARHQKRYLDLTYEKAREYANNDEAAVDFARSLTKPRSIEDAPSNAGPRALMTRSLDTVQMRAIDWLWTGWIPKGYITIWAGETGAGKSTVLADVAARVSTGAPWPGEQQWRQPGRVLWLGSEDGIEELTVPRLAACGANCANIVEIQGVIQDGRRRTFSLQDDLANVKAELKHARDAGQPFALLVIDPVTSYLPGQKLRKVDLNDAGQLRTILEPWLVLAQEYTLAIVCVTHFAKDTQRSMLHRVLGSAAFTQTCRSLCAVVSRPEEGQFEKALVQVKINLPEHPGGGWKFRTEKVVVATDQRSGRQIDATRAAWIELDQSVTPESFMGGERGPVAKAAPAFAFWVKQYFAALPPGTNPSVADVKAAALLNGIVGESWWNKNSGDFLQKWNDHGVWRCMPMPSASQAFNN